MLKKRICKYICIILCIIVVIPCGIKIKNRKKSIPDKISDYSDVVYTALMAEDSFSDSKLSMQDNGKDYYNYWAITVTAITAIREGDLDLATEIINRNMDTFYEYGYFPRPAFEKLDYGWVSCMDAPVVGVAAQMLYDVTGEVKYKRFVRDVSEYILSDVSEHGFVADINGSKWIFEYANTQTNKDNGEFVLNGSLLGTLTIEMLAQITEDERLQELVNSSIRSYQKYFSKYWYSDGEWCYYKLNELRVNQPHYIIYEIRLLDALYEVNGTKIFKEESDKRRRLLKEYYKLVINDENQFVFVRGGAPHYYYVDIHDTILNFYNSFGELLDSNICMGKDTDKFCMKGAVPQGTVRVQWIIHTKYWEINMGDLIIENVLPVNLKERKINAVFSASEDGKLDGNNLDVYYDKGKLTLNGKLEQSINIENDDIFLIEFINRSNTTIETTNVILYDTNNNAVSRYLTEITPGNTELFFAPIGFPQNQSNIDFSSIEEFNIRLYTSSLGESEQVNIVIGDIYKFDNQFEYYQYLEGR